MAPAQKKQECVVDTCMKTFYQWLQLKEADQAGQPPVPKTTPQAGQAGKPAVPKTTPQVSKTPVRTPRSSSASGIRRPMNRFYLQLPSFKALAPGTQQMVWQNAGRFTQQQLAQLPPEEQERVRQLNMDMIHSYQQSDDDDDYYDGAGILDDLGVPPDTPIPDDWRTANWGKIS